MKRFNYTVVIALFIPIFTFSQTMHVHLNDGRIDDYRIAEIYSITFTIHPSDETVTDIDGHEYETVTICDQVWMAENLRVTHYRNGDEIPNVSDNTAWSTSTEGAYCNYNNDESNADTYGCLYNWHAATDSRNIAPEGWHVPSDEEWQTLVDCLGGTSSAGGKLKEAGTDHWNSPNAGASNESGFTALPGGLRGWTGPFGQIGDAGGFYTTTESATFDYAWSRILNYALSDVDHSENKKGYGFSVRCVKD